MKSLRHNLGAILTPALVAHITAFPLIYICKQQNALFTYASNQPIILEGETGTNWVLLAIGFVDIELWVMSWFVSVAPLRACVCASWQQRPCGSSFWGHCWVERFVSSRSHTVIVLPLKLLYRSWGRGVGNGVFPKSGAKLGNREHMWRGCPTVVQFYCEAMCARLLLIHFLLQI